MDIPIINFGDMDLAVSRRMDKAFREVGFAVFTNVYDRWLSDFDLWEESIRQFFSLSPEDKSKYAYSSVTKNLGYSAMESE